MEQKRNPNKNAELSMEQNGNTAETMSYSAKCRLCRIYKLMKPLKILAFCETA